jgi:transcriptional regulator with XRE-family HTH domain
MERATMLIRRLGRFVRACRDELGITQEQMAARCGMSVKHFGQLERGDVEVTLSALRCLAKGLDMGVLDALRHVAESHPGRHPALNLRTWIQLKGSLDVLTDYVDRILSHAKEISRDDGAGGPVPRTRGRFVHRR